MTIDNILIALFLILAIALFFYTVRIVPQNEAIVVERLGKFHAVMEAGINFIIPGLDRVAYKHSLKEFAIDVTSQQAITKDNVALSIDGVLYLRILDPKAASYGVENLFFAVTQLAQTSMRAVIGRLTLDQTFESRDAVNAKVTQAIDEASNSWGTKVMRYEVRDISPPQSILDEMEKQMAAERERRVAVTTSEGYRQSQINSAEGDKQANILRAEGVAKSLEIEADARANAITTISNAIQKDGGSAAVSQQLAEQYIKAFEKLAREGTVAIVPTDSNDISSVVSKAYTVFDKINHLTETKAK